MIINPYRFAAAAGTALSADPIHWWDMNNLTTGIDDQGTNSATGPFSSRLAQGGTPDVTTGGFAPNSGECINFQPVEYLHNSSGANIAWDGTGNDYSLSIWVNADTITGFHFPINWRDTGGSGNLFFIFYANNGSPDDWRYIFYDSAGDNFTINGGTATSATWYHIVATWDDSATTGSLYVNNGSPITTTNASVQTLETASMPFSIGSLSTNKSLNGFDGKIWAIGMWDSVLDADDVAHLYNSGSGRLYADL